MHATAKGEVGVFLFCSMSSKFDETMWNILLLLLSKKINDESKYILFCKRAFSAVLEGVDSESSIEASPQTPIFSTITC